MAFRCLDTPHLFFHRPIYRHLIVSRFWLSLRNVVNILYYTFIGYVFTSPLHVAGPLSRCTFNLFRDIQMIQFSKAFVPCNAHQQYVQFRLLQVSIFNFKRYKMIFKTVIPIVHERTCYTTNV